MIIVWWGGIPLGKYSPWFWLFSQFLFPFIREHTVKNLVLLNDLKVCSAALNQASCLLEHTIHYSFVLDFTSYFSWPKFFLSCIYVLGKGIKMKKKKQEEEETKNSVYTNY